MAGPGPPVSEPWIGADVRLVDCPEMPLRELLFVGVVGPREMV